MHYWKFITFLLQPIPNVLKVSLTWCFKITLCIPTKLCKDRNSTSAPWISRSGKEAIYHYSLTHFSKLVFFCDLLLLSNWQRTGTAALNVEYAWLNAWHRQFYLELKRDNIGYDPLKSWSESLGMCSAALEHPWLHLFLAMTSHRMPCPFLTAAFRLVKLRWDWRVKSSNASGKREV